VVPSFERRRPARRPLPGRLPRERIVYPAPSVCPCCGGGTLRKIGEDVTETLELIPRQWREFGVDYIVEGAGVCPASGHL
jgi:transposase